MADLENNRQIVRQVLSRYAGIQPAYGEIEREVIFDSEHDRYQVVNVGWENRRRIYGCLIHVDIKDDKIWVQYDGTEMGIANELVELGISKQNIVLAYQSSYMRQFTEFAVS
ncbi:XisI protein [Pseudanabaenaceae cyanobacterium LEGE 13415]|nr:XisI protein [Pseudanabaenaceae cyanobacterium LEGE 13415]